LVALYYAATRQVSAAQGRTLSENARDFALLGITGSDSFVACFDTKYTYNFWQPVATIRAGDTDGNPRTSADPDWLPLITTPAHPSYPSAHASAAGAARAVLEHLYGEDRHDITLTTPSLPDIVLHYTAWEQITDDIDDARIYGGIHYRFDQEAGARQGRQVGRYILLHELRPVRHDHRNGLD
ncbi:MAG TPA: vanadium-dependent haloperoxidase, partial [Opitutaceae bacterium]